MKYLVNYVKIDNNNNEFVENDEFSSVLQFHAMFDITVKSGVKFGYTLVDWNDNATYNNQPIAAILVKETNNGTLLEIITEL